MGASQSFEKTVEGVKLHPVDETFRVVGLWHVPFLTMLSVFSFVRAWHKSSINYYIPLLSYECATPNVTSACSKECKEIIFGDALLKETMVNEWDLICDRAGLRNLILAMFGSGIFVGSILPPFLADRFGRRIVFIIGVIAVLLSGIFMGFTPWLSLFCVFQFFNGLGLGSIEMLGYIIAYETVGIKHRAIVAGIMLISYVTGHMSFSIFLYTLKTWRKVQIVHSCVSLVSLPVIFVLPESPRWLLVMGQRERAADILKTAALRNKLSDKNIERQVNAYKVNSQDGLKTRAVILDFILNKAIRSKMLLLLLCWFCVYLGYNSVSKYITIISKDTYLFNAIGAVQVPALILCIVSVQIWGRRPTIALSFTVAGTALVVITMLPPNPVGIDYFSFVLFTVIGLASLIMSFMNILIMGFELIPTVGRATGLGILNAVGLTAQIVANFFGLIIMVDVTAVIFSICVLFAALLSLLFPETKDLPLPDTVGDIEDFERDRK